MTGLVIRLAPHERVLLNGAVIENGDRRASLSIKTPNANVLRLRDAIHPEQANSPVKRTIYMLQLVLSGDSRVEDVRAPLLRAIDQLGEVFRDADSQHLLRSASTHVLSEEYYLGLKFLRLLLPKEAQLLARGAP